MVLVQPVTSAIRYRCPRLVLDWSSIDPLLILYFSGVLSGLYERPVGLCWRGIRLGISHSNRIWTLLLEARLRVVFGLGRLLGWRRLCWLELLNRGKRQAAAAFEQAAQTAVAGAARTLNHYRGNAVAQLAAPAAAFEPVFPAHDLTYWDRGGFWS